MNSKAIISGAGKYDGEYFIDTSMTLGFLPLTEAEKQKLVERAAQDLAYEAGASARTLAKASPAFRFAEQHSPRTSPSKTREGVTLEAEVQDTKLLGGVGFIFLLLCLAGCRRLRNEEEV